MNTTNFWESFYNTKSPQTAFLLMRDFDLSPLSVPSSKSVFMLLPVQAAVLRLAV